LSEKRFSVVAVVFEPKGNAFLLVFFLHKRGAVVAKTQMQRYILFFSAHFHFSVANQTEGRRRSSDGHGGINLI